MGVGGFFNLPILQSSDAHRAASAGLARREGRAITYTLFNEFVESGEGQAAEWEIRRAISALYCDEYLHFNGATIPTGIAGLGYFESLFPEGFPQNDINILSRVFSFIGLKPLLEQPAQGQEGFWEYAASVRGGPEFIARALQKLIAIAHEVEPDKTAARGFLRETTVQRVCDWIEPSLRPFASGETFVGCLQRSAEMLTSVLQRLGKDPFVGHLVERLYSDREIKADWLVVTATGIEVTALRSEFQRRYKYVPEIRVFGDTVTEYMGSVKGNSVWHVTSQMGSSGPGGSAFTVYDAISVLDPARIVSTGIAFGVDERKQKIGQVLVAESVIDYDIGRVGTAEDGSLVFTSRSDRPSADANLLSRYRAVSGNAEFGMATGPMLSGSALVDNLGFRERIKQLAPTAIGGEMEGYGVYSAAERRHVPWIVAKAICDWADGTKSRNKRGRQERAAAAAASLTCDTIDLG